ncbi:hypothetical protein [Paenibacillus taichungensis]
MSLNFTIDWGSVVISVPLLALTIWGGTKYLSKKYVDQKFLEKLENHKHDLQNVVESNKFNIQKKMYDFSLYTTRKHEVYAQLYQLFMISHGSLANLWGTRQIPDFKKYSLSQIRQYLSDYDASEEELEYYTRNWTGELSNKIPFANELEKFHNKYGVGKARADTIKSNNEFLLSSLYLSTLVYQKCENLNKKMKDLREDFEFVYGDEMDTETKISIRRTLTKKLNDVSDELSDLRIEMKNELAIGSSHS